MTSSALSILFQHKQFLEPYPCDGRVCLCEGTSLSDVLATVIDPSGVEDRCDIAEDSPGVYQVLFQPRETGLHLVTVNKNHSPVPGTFSCR